MYKRARLCMCLAVLCALYLFNDAHAAEYDAIGRLVAISYDESSATLSVVGAGGPDLIHVRPADDGAILVNGREVVTDGHRPTISNTALVRIDGGGGDDILVASSLPAAALNGGSGVDHAVWRDDLGMIVAADSAGVGSDQSGADAGSLLGGTAVDGIYTGKGENLLDDATIVDVDDRPVILVRGSSSASGEDVIINGDAIPINHDYDDDGDLDLYLVNAPGGDNAFDDDGDLDLYLVNAPGGDNAFDDDGDLDLFLVNAPGGDNAVLEDDPDLYLIGLPGNAADDDGDGDLDIYATEGILGGHPCPPAGGAPRFICDL